MSRLPLQRTPDGIYWTDGLWQQDLAAHFDYIPNLQICAPVDDVPTAPEGSVRIDQVSDKIVTPLRRDQGLGSVARNFFPNFL